MCQSCKTTKKRHLFQVLLKEIGSEEEVSKALSEQPKEGWKGRAAKISSLEAQIENLKNIANAAAHSGNFVTCTKSNKYLRVDFGLSMSA